jgi:proteasome assembly chaperone (PAC2) family protein
LSQGCPAKFDKEPGLRHSRLVLSWREDIGDFGQEATGYLIQRLGGEEFAEIAPEDFFSLGGVSVEANVARFPESKFYVCRERELVIFRSDSPAAEWYRFLESVLDVAEHHCGTKELYALGAMVSLDAHTAPRQLLSVVNSAEMKESLSRYELAGDMDYQTPPGERPTLNSLLLWLAKKRSIRGVSLWAPIPFYVAAMGDPQAQKKVLTFLNERLDLRIDFSDLDREIREHNERLARARSRYLQVDDYISRLESNLILSQEENGDLLKKVEESLKQED